MTASQEEYGFFALLQIDRSWRLLSPEERRSKASDLLQSLQAPEPLRLHTYCTTGLRPEGDLLLWLRAPNPEALQEFLARILKGAVGGYLNLPQLFFGISRPSPYTGHSSAWEDVGSQPYLVVYPFTKTPEWYQLPPEERRSLMEEHMRTASQFPGIRQHIYYAYGVADQEFILVYEAPSLPLFQDLIIALRETRARPYTLHDTPIITGVRRDGRELASLLL